MNWESWFTWLIGPTGALAGLAAWLVRRRKASADGTTPSGFRLWRWLRAAKNLKDCEDELTSDRTRYERQLAANQRELAARENEIAYLAAKLNRLMTEGEGLIRANDAASATPSSPSANAPTP